MITNKYTSDLGLGGTWARVSALCRCGPNLQFSAAAARLQAKQKGTYGRPSFWAILAILCLDQPLQCWQITKCTKILVLQTPGLILMNCIYAKKIRLWILFFSGNRGKPEHSCGGWPSNLGQVDEGWPEKGDNTTVKIILKMGLIAKLLTSVLYTLHLPFQMMTLWEGWVVGWAHLCNTPCSLTQFCLLQPHQRTLDTYGAILWHQQKSWWGKLCHGSLFK